MSLTALTLRYACDQTSREPMAPFDGMSGERIYLGNPCNVQAAMFSGPPEDGKLINDLAATVTQFSLVIRKVDYEGELIVQQDVVLGEATPIDTFNGGLTYFQWLNGVSQHIQFRLNPLDMNVAVPSCGQLQYHATIVALTAAGPVTAGYFRGYFVDDGSSVWVIGVAASGAPVLYFRLIDSYTTANTSLEFINGSLLTNDSIVKVVINESDSEWLVFKPATKETSVDEGIIKLIDGTAHLERTTGL